MIPKHEIDEAIEAVARHNDDGMQNKMNHRLEFTPSSFWIAGTSRRVDGKIASCYCGDNLLIRTFTVFQLDHQDHIHLQCSHCGTSYCPVGKCKL